MLNSLPLQHPPLKHPGMQQTEQHRSISARALPRLQPAPVANKIANAADGTTSSEKNHEAPPAKPDGSGSLDKSCARRTAEAGTAADKIRASCGSYPARWILGWRWVTEAGGGHTRPQTRWAAVPAVLRRDLCYLNGDGSEWKRCPVSRRLSVN